MMKLISEQKCGQVTVTYKLFLDHLDILDLLKDQIPGRAQNIKITFCMPGGGDWSGQSINVSSDTPVTAEYTIKTLEKR